MNVVLHHEAIVLDLLPLEALLVEMLFGDFARENLTSHEIAAAEDQLHLIQNEVNFFHSLKRAVSLNLDLLDHLGSIIMLPVSLQHLSVHASDLSVLSFQEHLALAGLSKRIEHLVALLSAGELVKYGVAHAPLDHVSYGFLCLPTTLDQLQHEISQVRQVMMIEGQTQLDKESINQKYRGKVVVLMTCLLGLEHQVVDLFKECGPGLPRGDLKHPLLLSSLDLMCHLT